MRRFVIAALMALGALGLAAGAASAQYVTSPGQTPGVGSAQFSGESAEVRGESVERETARTEGSAGLAGSPAEGTSGAEAGEAGDVAGAQVAGLETSRADDLADVENRELRSGAARASREGSGLRDLLAFTGIALGVMAVAGAALLGIGKVLHSFRETEA